MPKTERQKAAANIKTLGWTYWRGYWRKMFCRNGNVGEVKFRSPLEVCAWLRGESAPAQGKEGTA